MLRILRGGQRWLTAIFIVGIGGVFVLFLGLQGPMTGGGSSTIVRVGPHEFGIREFERARRSREAAIQEELGASYDPKALRDTIDNLAARELVDRALLALAAEELGLTVSKREVERFVLSDPSFRDEGGRFDREAFERYTEYEYGSQHAFLEDQRLRLLALKMLRVLTGQPAVSEGEARAAVRRELEEIRIAFVALDARKRSEDVVIAPEAVQGALEEREDEIEALYAELSDRYDRPERVRARHILLSVPSDASEDEVARVRGEMEAALERIRAGEDFAAVAGEVSEDPGSKSRGGDLGFFGRGQMVPAFEEVAFALEPGELSDIVRTDYGFHLIRTEERQEAVHRPLAEVREEVAEELLRREAVNEAAHETAGLLAAAVREGRSLEQAAREAELDLQRSGWIARKAGGFVPGLGSAPELLSVAFALGPAESSPRVFEVGEQLALVQLLERREPAREEVAPRVDDKREELLVAKRNTRASAWIDARRQDLVESGDLQVNLEPVRFN